MHLLAILFYLQVMIAISDMNLIHEGTLVMWLEVGAQLCAPATALPGLAGCLAQPAAALPLASLPSMCPLSLR